MSSPISNAYPPSPLPSTGMPSYGAAPYAPSPNALSPNLVQLGGPHAPALYQQPSPSRTVIEQNNGMSNKAKIGLGLSVSAGTIAGLVLMWAFTRTNGHTPHRLGEVEGHLQELERLYRRSAEIDQRMKELEKAEQSRPLTDEESAESRRIRREAATIDKSFHEQKDAALVAFGTWRKASEKECRQYLSPIEARAGESLEKKAEIIQCLRREYDPIPRSSKESITVARKTVVGRT